MLNFCKEASILVSSRTRTIVVSNNGIKMNSNNFKKVRFDPNYDYGYRIPVIPFHSAANAANSTSRRRANVNQTFNGNHVPSFYNNFYPNHPQQSRRFPLASLLMRTSSTTTDMSFDMDSEGHSVQQTGVSSTEAPRAWEHTDVGQLLNANTSTSFNHSFRFSLMSYNILAPGLLEKHSEMFKSCHPASLNWETRLDTIFQEISRYNPDILCFQEVEADQFEFMLQPRFDKLRYRGVFKKKTGDKDDGCAIFYRHSKFLLHDKLEVEFLQPHVPLLNRDNVALLLKLETRNVAKRSKIVVGTTHLLFNPKRHDVRLAQAQLLLAELDRFAYSGFDKNRRPVYFPILMTGDLNCLPHNSVTSLMSEGQLQCFDENGEMLRCFKSRILNSLLPTQCGISDQCQHYKIVLERYKRWTLARSNPLDREVKWQESFVDLFPYLNSRPAYSEERETTSNSNDDDVVSIYSQAAENVGLEPSVSDMEVAANSQFLAKAAKKMVFQHISSSNGQSNETIDKPHLKHLNRNVLSELGKLGLPCNFGTGSLSHNFNFRDVHGAKLDRRSNESGVTTRQSGWVCVDYIFQSMTWNDSFNKPVEGQLKLIRRLGLPTRKDCIRVGNLPNSYHPSDHFPLVAEFLIR